MHDALRLVHERGSCRDDALVQDVLDSHAFVDEERIRSEIARHTRVCPSPAPAIGHEITRARFHPHPTAPFMATARLDAVWLVDGPGGSGVPVLDAHDYKTGKVWHDRVADDAQARLQAWVLAPLAEARGARLRITFEHLAAEVLDDPEPFEPDADDLEAIGAELHATVLEIRAEADAGEWAGVADTELCGRCRYRSICPVSAAPAMPVWPTYDDDLTLPTPTPATLSCERNSGSSDFAQSVSTCNCPFASVEVTTTVAGSRLPVPGSTIT